MSSKTACFRFFGALNDFLPGQKRESEIEYFFHGKPAVKDAIEAIGVPHAEIDLIFVNNLPVDFSYHLQAGDKIKVYPVLEKNLDFPASFSLSKIPEKINIKFIADVHLGKLASLLRMLGFDTVYKNSFTEKDILKFAEQEKIIVLTRNVFLLKNNKIKPGLGYWLRNEDPEMQLKEVIKRFDLMHLIKAFVRCMDCNGLIKPITKIEVQYKLEPQTNAYFNEFFQCRDCGKIYWKGSHYERMEAFIRKLKTQ